jgi:hypothetical protein
VSCQLFHPRRAVVICRHYWTMTVEDLKSKWTGKRELRLTGLQTRDKQHPRPVTATVTDSSIPTKRCTCVNILNQLAVSRK